MNGRTAKLINKVASRHGQNRKRFKRSWAAVPWNQRHRTRASLARTLGWVGRESKDLGIF